MTININILKSYWEETGAKSLLSGDKNQAEFPLGQVWKSWCRCLYYSGFCLDPFYSPSYELYQMIVSNQKAGSCWPLRQRGWRGAGWSWWDPDLVLSNSGALCLYVRVSDLPVSNGNSNSVWWTMFTASEWTVWSEVGKQGPGSPGPGSDPGSGWGRGSKLED